MAVQRPEGILMSEQSDAEADADFMSILLILVITLLSCILLCVVHGTRCVI